MLRVTTAILALFFLGEPGRLSRCPPACHAGSAKFTSGHCHNHSVLADSKAPNEDVSLVIHGSLHHVLLETLFRAYGTPRRASGLLVCSRVHSASQNRLARLGMVAPSLGTSTVPGLLFSPSVQPSAPSPGRHLVNAPGLSLARRLLQLHPARQS